jgi:hypothetical protein
VLALALLLALSLGPKMGGVTVKFALMAGLIQQVVLLASNMTGKWPNSEISYLNGKPSDTRWANLREATSSPNRNRPKRK